ncbi:MAG: hypothetical protein Q9218_006479 [Villophora microphyllina]
MTPQSNGGDEELAAPHAPHILIIGAGITGLVLAQALKKHGIAFTVFERDADVAARGRGWGLTIHWSLDTFISLLPQHIVDKLPQVYVDPEASKNGDNGNFLFFDLQSGEPRWKVPPNKRIRVSRERLRALLLEGLDVQTLDSISTPNLDAVTAHFTDTTAACGTLLVGADGSRSRARSILLRDPTLAINKILPVRLLGASVVYPRHFAQGLRNLDPFFFQGGDPASDAFMFFSFLDTPVNNPRSDPDTYECQILVSWPYRKGFRGREKPLDVPSTNEARIALMKELVGGWANPFRDAVINIPADAEIKAIALEDFLPKKGLWDNRGGKVTLMGDAAHAMTMYRGEAYNHGVADIAGLLSQILPVLSPSSSAASTTETRPSLQQAIDAYEAEMIQRTAPAVLTSRRACLDAHEYSRISDQSPLVSRRVMVSDRAIASSHQMIAPPRRISPQTAFASDIAWILLKGYTRHYGVNVLARVFLLLKPTNQTQIEYHDGITPAGHEPHIVQTFRYLTGGECCVPLDLVFRNGERETFTPYRVIFEYFGNNALFVFAYGENKPACSGPSVDGYKDPGKSSYVKDFVARPQQKFSGAMFTLGGSGPLSATAEGNGTLGANETVLDKAVGHIVYPWSITYQGLTYYQKHAGSLEYYARGVISWIRGIPKMELGGQAAVADA